MAKFGFLLDNDVRHLHAALPARQTRQLEEVGLSPASNDHEIVHEASLRNLLIVTNNRRDFQQAVAKRIGESTRRPDGCTQVHGLVIVKPTEAITQLRVLAAAPRKLIFEGRNIGWKTVFEEALQVVIETSGVPRITRLPRCPFCAAFGERRAS